jgi:D-serine deaminase-like pyridoxal phosphate-dependent protein
MTTIDELPTPALLLDLDKLEANLDDMAARATRLGVALRPHVKTHKCIEIGERQRARGASGITVSTLHEAQVFAEHGFDDILWAFPIILSRVAEAQALAERITLRVVIDTGTALQALRETRFPFHVHLKVDAGYHRAGVDPRSAQGRRLAHELAGDPHLMFGGILSHSGQAYDGGGSDAITKVAEGERRIMAAFAEALEKDGIAVPQVSVGSTPAMTYAPSLEGVTEARPGNYALFDYTQTVLGSCTVGDCAATVLASVVSSQPGASHCVIDAGALALSKDTGPASPNGGSMGRVFEDYATATLHSDLHLTGVSQEHGKLNRALPVGRRLRILPNHSCLTVAHFDEMHVVRGRDVVDRWKVWRGR